MTEHQTGPASPLIDAQLAALGQTVKASYHGQQIPDGEVGEAAVGSIILTAALGRAVELGVPREGIEGIFGQVMQFEEAMENAAAAAEANGPAEQLEVWFDACGASVLERANDNTSPLELFAMVYDFAAGTALGTGLSIDDAMAIVKRCQAQLLTQVGAGQTPAPPPPAVAPRRYDVPT